MFINKSSVCLLFLIGSCLIAFCYGKVVVGFDVNAKNDCELPRNRGPCSGRYHSYYFDLKARDCKPFIWSGCGGNGNRFYSRDECQFACSYYMKLN